jgi:hypothetical protein
MLPNEIALESVLLAITLLVPSVWRIRFAPRLLKRTDPRIVTAPVPDCVRVEKNVVAPFNDTAPVPVDQVVAPFCVIDP